MLNTEEPSITWTVFKSLRGMLNVQVVGWTRDGRHHWNVYAKISSKSPIYNNDFDDAPFHGGVTMDDRNKSQAFEVKYDHQREHEYRKVGSDYGHYMDCYEYYSPIDGIPYDVQKDAESLIEYIERLLAEVK